MSTLIFILSFVLAITWGGGAFSQTKKEMTSDYMTIEEAAAALKLPGAAAPLAEYAPSPPLPARYAPPFISIQPIKLFDSLYFVGTTAVGAFIIDTGDGLVMLDTGSGDADAALMASDMKKLGLDPSKIKLILISHEHFDHYGGVQYLKRNFCPKAKVAISLVGWNMLQTYPPDWAHISSWPQSVDIYLTDGMKIKVGNVIFQIVATPGHSPGCMSFIFPVTDNGSPHMVGIMGGTAVWRLELKPGYINLQLNILKHLLWPPGAISVLGLIHKRQTLQHFVSVSLVILTRWYSGRRSSIQFI
jgi:glyoxylase-like metal-dependent hydrolase (beta-lactamase superfamily II)